MDKEEFNRLSKEIYKKNMEDEEYRETHSSRILKKDKKKDNRPR
jgi:hypothetical protein